jgi:hypothetical protein
MRFVFLFEMFLQGVTDKIPEDFRFKESDAVT